MTLRVGYDQFESTWIAMTAEAEVARNGVPSAAGLVDELIAATCSLYAGFHLDRLAPSLAWPAHASDRIVDPRPLPVVRWLSGLGTELPEDCARVVAALRKAAAVLAWRQTYTAQDVGTEFLDNYAWTELIGERGPVSSSTLACGLLLLGPGTVYPRHRHGAEEIYVAVSGTASWQQGDGVWRPRPPGTLIHHACDEPHAMSVGAEPLLAAYLWSGGRLAEKATLG
jgi:hypothetical protein